MNQQEISELNPLEIEAKLMTLRYNDAIEWVKEHLGGVREEMGSPAIARFKVQHSQINAVMFYPYDNHLGCPQTMAKGYAGNISFNYNY